MKRVRALRRLGDLVRAHPVVALLGPRQAGKTTLAGDYARASAAKFPAVTRFDLEDPLDLTRLDNPRLTLDSEAGLVIIDEIHRKPELFPLLRVLADRGPKSRRFLILGSASGDMLRQSSESLAGRLGFMELTPFCSYEVPDLNRLWWRGGYPPAYLARSAKLAAAWLAGYVRTFLERDLPSFGVRVPSETLRRFWMTLAHYHGQVVNLSEIGRAFGLSYKTVAHYTDILTSTFMVRLLQPWYENIAKRQVKSPKLYFRDSGLLHHLLGITEPQRLLVHPSIGASWEGFALECIVRELDLEPGQCFFWSTHAHAELDMLAFVNGRRIGFEIKRTDAPKLERSMSVALVDLRLDHLFVVFAGTAEFRLADKVSAFGLGLVSQPRARWRAALRGSKTLAP